MTFFFLFSLHSLKEKKNKKKPYIMMRVKGNEKQSTVIRLWIHE